MKSLNIEIAAHAGSGKTTIAYKFGSVLKSYGIKVTILDEELAEDEFTPETIERNLNAIGKDSEVVIRCRQLKRTVL